LAAKDIDPEFYKEWKSRHHKARQDFSRHFHRIFIVSLTASIAEFGIIIRKKSSDAKISSSGLRGFLGH